MCLIIDFLDDQFCFFCPFFAKKVIDIVLKLMSSLTGFVKNSPISSGFGDSATQNSFKLKHLGRFFMSLTPQL